MTIEARLLEWNAEAILAKVPKVLEKVGAELGEEARSQITSIKWDWPNVTLRFTSLGMGGSPDLGSSGPFSPPTTRAGAANTNRFKGKIQNTRAPGRGIFVGTPRDIVDTGRLLASQTDPIVDGNSVVIRWNAPYSGLILKGGQFKPYVNPRGETVDPGNKPGRDWIAATFAAKPVLPLFVRYWAETPTQR